MKCWVSYAQLSLSSVGGALPGCGSGLIAQSQVAAVHVCQRQKRSPIGAVQSGAAEHANVASATQKWNFICYLNSNSNSHAPIILDNKGCIPGPRVGEPGITCSLMGLGPCRWPGLAVACYTGRSESQLLLEAEGV